jgi:hypothetical protein
MKTHSDKVKKDIEKVLNDEGMKANLIIASLYITSFELLKSTIVRRIQQFYSRGEFDSQGESIPSEPDYTNEVRNLYRDSKGRGNVLRASLAWLKNVNAIDERDEKDFLVINNHRNEIVHELSKYLIYSDFQVNSQHIARMQEILRKIEIWWIVNVEIPSNSEFDGKIIEDKDVIPGTVAILQHIVSLALRDYQSKDL